MLSAYFKVSLYENRGDEFGKKIEVKRFETEARKEELYTKLYQQIYDEFEILKVGREHIDIGLYWKDSEGEYIHISNNDNLLHAMNEMGGKTSGIHVLMHRRHPSGLKFG